MSHHRYRRIRVHGVGRIPELGKRAVSYIRRSAELHDAPTLAMQYQCLREYARKQGWNLVEYSHPQS